MVLLVALRRFTRPSTGLHIPYMSALAACVSSILFPCIFLYEAIVSLLKLRPCCMMATIACFVLFILRAAAPQSVDRNPLSAAPEPPPLTMRTYWAANPACPGPSCVLPEKALEVDGCPGPRCVLHEAVLADSPNRRSRRGRRSRRRHHTAATSSSSPTLHASSSAMASVRPAANTSDSAHEPAPPAFHGLLPQSPLPLPYVQHLAYMKMHPHNRPDFQGQGSASRGTWMTVVPGYERGLATRDKELQAIQRQSGWDPSDSPAVALPPPWASGEDAAAPGIVPVLTGNAWHHGRGRCPDACRVNGGVCLPALGRCDCPRHRLGPVCELHVEPAVSRTHLHHGWCVYNDSSPFFCDKPLCEHATNESHRVVARLGVGRGGSTGFHGRRRQGGPRRELCLGDPLDTCPSRCNGKGTCRRGRCSCIPGYSGAACESSIPWFCISNCLGRGKCEMGFCQCRAPYYGVDCSLQPLWEHDSTPGSPPPPPLPEGHLGHITGPVGSSVVHGDRQGSRHGSVSPRRLSRCWRPCVYVYELPARMNVLALKAEPHWPFYEHGPADYRGFKAVHISLLRSPHRTADPAKADLFYVPTWDLHGSWGNPEIYWRAFQYIRNVLPFWNRTQGADHVWTNTRDAGGCSNPWGSIWDQTRRSSLLTNWGGVTGLGGVPTERCFDATLDIVIPGVLKSKIVAKSPFLPFHQRHPDDPAAAAAAAVGDTPMARRAWERRSTLLFFHGAICWQTYDHVRSLSALARKCKQKHGFLDHYSFGVRWEIYRRFHAEPGFNLRATDLLPPPPHRSNDDQMLASVFCLCPSGTGWGMRVFHSAALGCIPVIIQRDDSNTYPPVLQAFEGLVLDWSAPAVRLEYSDLPNLPNILRRLAANSTALKEKRRALASMWTRLLWREALPTDIARLLQKAPDAFDSLMQTLYLRKRYGLQPSGQRAQASAGT